MSQKRKRIVLTIEQKLEIINRVVDKGESVKKLSAEFGVGEQRVRDIVKKKKIFLTSLHGLKQCVLPHPGKP